MLKKLTAKIRYIFQYKSKNIDRAMFYLSLLFMFFVINHIGNVFGHQYQDTFEDATVWIFYGLFVLTLLITSGELLFTKINISHYTGIFVVGYFLLITIARLTHIPFLEFLTKETWLQLGIAIVFISQLSKNSLFFDKLYFNPTILFVISFLVIILIGTFLLMVPRATYTAPLGFIDAFFMATSAVCITGLGVVDVATDFSLFGKTVVMILMQAGGLGIMTFTGFFGYFFSGGFSFKNQLMYGEILSENKLTSVISTLLKIIFITLLFEFVGGVFIYFSLDDQLFSGREEKLFFTTFHTVSAFCNAGFSTIHGGLGNESFRFNYPFQIVLTCMFILGGLGFNTIYNFYTFIKSKIKGFIYTFILHKKYIHKAQLFTFNTKFVIVCNIIVIILATVSFYFLEGQHALTEDQGVVNKISASFFTANNARSTGFGSVDVNFIGGPTLILFISLMWMGSSPGSTGGGVKVTTVAIALLNVVFLARGKKDMEIFKRRIADETKNKAFAIIVLSFLVITISFVLLNFSDSDQPMKELLFESISAYSTSGLSMGITANLSSIGKMIIIFTMFVGRVGMLTLLVAFIKNTKNKSYTYPTEKILF
ncbi:MAG TPA: potassium transporter TrkG [Sphingobacterium sp.]|nr:potassium transporter TrkG [Sphingobacterium sp.]